MITIPVFNALNDFSWLVSLLSVIVGALLGWLLAKPKKRKLDFTIRNISNPAGGTYTKGKSIFQEVRYYFTLVVYNPSDFTRVIKNMKIEIKDSEGKIIAQSPVRDQENAYESGIHRILMPIEVANFAPRYAEIIKCYFEISYKEFLVTKGSLIKEQKLIYEDEKKKRREIPIILTAFDKVEIYRD